MFVLPMASLGELQAQQALLKQELAKMSAAKKVAAKKLKRSQGETSVARLLHDAGSANTAPKLAKGVAPELLLLLEFSGIHNSDKGSSVTDVLTSYVLGQGRHNNAEIIPSLMCGIKMSEPTLVLALNSCSFMLMTPLSFLARAIAVTLR